jgi:renal tumor antigen
LIKKLGEGTFSEVFKAQVIKTGEFVAVKCMKEKYTNIETVNSLREIRSLKRLSIHKNIIRLLEVLL